MDGFAQLPVQEQEEIFNETAGRMSVDVLIVEKDFWVCWTLQTLFALPADQSPMVFKGGTSLSKGYNLIDRFSEDIDVVTVAEFFIAHDSHRKLPKQSKSRARMDALDVACSRYIVGLKTEPRNSSIDASNKHRGIFRRQRPQPFVAFTYPQNSKSTEYIAPRVKIELGWRSEDHPTESRTIRPYVADHLHRQREARHRAQYFSRHERFGKGHDFTCRVSAMRRDHFETLFRCCCDVRNRDGQDRS